MDITLFLTQLFGLYFLVMGIVLVVRHKTLSQIINNFLADEALMFFAGIFVLLLGLSLVLVHNSWGTGIEWVITLIAWLTLLKGIFYLLFPSVIISISKWFSSRGMFVYGGIFAILIGLYLTSQGFGVL